MGLVVYDSAADYYAGTPKYTLDSAHGIGIRQGSDGIGDTHLAKLLTDPQAPDSSYQIVGDDSEPEVRDLAFNPPADIRFPDTGGLITCLPRCATVLTGRNEIYAARLHPGDRVLTRDHGFQPVDWTSAEQGDGEMVYVATRQGVLQAADAPTAKILILSHRFANQSR